MAGKLRIAAAMMAVLSLGCSTGGRLSAKSTQTTNGSETACNQPRMAIDIGIGWTVEKARERSPALAHITPALANWAPAAYVSEPKRVKLEGSIPLEVLCPHLVIVTPKNGHVVEVAIDLPPTSDLDAAMRLLNEWHGKLESMKLDPPPASLLRLDKSPEELRVFFQKTDFPGGPIGGSTGSWRRGQEVISIGVEKRNIGLINQPRYIYVVGLTVQDVSMWTGK